MQRSRFHRGFTLLLKQVRELLIQQRIDLIRIALVDLVLHLLSRDFPFFGALQELAQAKNLLTLERSSPELVFDLVREIASCRASMFQY